jgi:hypothetical protein
MKIFMRLSQYFPVICGIKFEALDVVGGESGKSCIEESKV